MLGIFGSWNNNFQGTKAHKPGLIVIGSLGVFMLLLALTGSVPSRLTYLDDDGQPTAFRVPGEEKYAAFRYPKPASLKSK